MADDVVQDAFESTHLRTLTRFDTRRGPLRAVAAPP